MRLRLLPLALLVTAPLEGQSRMRVPYVMDTLPNGLRVHRQRVPLGVLRSGEHVDPGVVPAGDPAASSASKNRRRTGIRVAHECDSASWPPRPRRAIHHSTTAKVSATATIVDAKSMRVV